MTTPAAKKNYPLRSSVLGTARPAKIAPPKKAVAPDDSADVSFADIFLPDPLRRKKPTKAEPGTYPIGSKFE